jgi:predicted nucleic acid-binding protein
MGVIIVDAGVLIAFLDSADIHHTAAHGALAEALREGSRLMLPASAFAEVSVGPSRVGPKKVATLRALIHAVPFEIGVLDEQTALAAASIRATHPTLKMPDALIVATAIVHDADEILTTDRRWPSSSGLGLRGVVTEI